MCIIAIKPNDLTLWDYATVKRMFDSNPDGAGYMYPADGKVHIKKGFTTPDGLYSSLRTVPADLPIVLHCRIGTHGSKTRPENTHPFPITDKPKYLESRRLTCPVGVAHNGVIAGMGVRQELSDTQIFIADVLYPFIEHYPTFYADERYTNIVAKLIGSSKLVFLDADGGIYTIGNFITTPDGYIYSNTSYEEKKVVVWPTKKLRAWHREDEFDRVIRMFPVPDGSYYYREYANTKPDKIVIDTDGLYYDDIGLIYQENGDGTVSEIYRYSNKIMYNPDGTTLMSGKRDNGVTKFVKSYYGGTYGY